MVRFSPLDRDVQYLKGVGPKRAKLFERLGIHTARELLYHTPRRYEDASTVTPIGTLEAGMDVTIVGRVVSKGVLPTRKGLRIFQAVVRDRSGLTECAWPGQPFLDRIIQRGDLLLLSGPVRFFHGRQLQPREYTILASEGERAPSGEGVVFPIYPATEGLTHRHLRQIIAENLDELLAWIAEADILPEALYQSVRVPPLADALESLHRPRSLAEAESGRRRLAVEEFYLQQIVHAKSHLRVTHEQPGIAFPRGGAIVPRFYRDLPFELTGAQKRVLSEIAADMGTTRRMNRLLQGDVGSGKTVVALFAALRAIENGYQAALMVPTEVLAEQHARSLAALVGTLGIDVELLTGRLAPSARRAALDRIASGDAMLVVGTHALIQPDVRFHRLGLAIVDEQHRFGVRQRLALADHGNHTRADVLVMSATPIPRSLALTLYGDLDISLLDERPPGRRPIRTALRHPRDRERIHAFLREQVREGRQAYIVYPLVDESEKTDLAAATVEFERLRDEVFRELSVGLIHGQMTSEEKDRAMRAFVEGETRILVATTVIEVGIDVANATVMVIEHAERFGLSQLHQLRGRVGRGGNASYCILVSEAGEAIERLRTFARTEDGFRIAEADLRLRGQGDLFGSRQSGFPAFRWARLDSDFDLLSAARETARSTIGVDPDLQRDEALRQTLERQYPDHIDLFQTG